MCVCVCVCVCVWKKSEKETEHEAHEKARNPGPPRQSHEPLIGVVHLELLLLHVGTWVTESGQSVSRRCGDGDLGGREETRKVTGLMRRWGMGWRGE